MTSDALGSEFIPPQEIGVEDCAFYHSMDIPGVGEVKGTWDLRGRFEDYVGHVDVSMSALPSGFLTFEAGMRGAQVTSFDVGSAADYQHLPSPYVPERSEAVRERRNGYWLAHKAFRCRLRRRLSVIDSGSSA